MDQITRTLVDFLRLPKDTRRAVLVLEHGKLPRLTVEQFVCPPIGAQIRTPRLRAATFDLVPVEERRAMRERLESIRLDLSVGADEDAAAAGATLAP